MTTEEMADKVIEYVCATGYVSFVELERLFPAAEVKGEHCLEILPNVILWANMSAQFAAVFDLERVRDTLEMHPASILVYLADGAVPQLPLAKRPRAYKAPHWAPVTFSRRKRPRNSQRADQLRARIVNAR